jgi:hypothetical protein
MPVRLHGSGEFGPIGFVSIHGSLRNAIPDGGESGQLVLANARGRVVLRVDGSTGGSTMGPLVGSITQGTGAFRGAAGGSPLIVEITQQQPRGPLTIGIAPQPPPPQPVPLGKGAITGYVDLGPITPVVRAGQSDTIPLAGATIVLETLDTQTEVARTETNTSGIYEFSGLAPGQYLIVAQPRSGDVFGFAIQPNPQQITVVSGAESTANAIHYDTAIR